VVTLALACGLCVAWGYVLARVWRTTGAVRRLPHAAVGLGPEPKKVSAVLAARNESATIERAVRSLLAQEGVRMQVVAVDDGSTDDTLQILERVAAEDDRLLVLKSKRTIPTGWVAKNFALELGQGRADGDFLLFTDADVIHGRRALLHAVSVMEQDKLDHLAVHPRLEAGSLIEALVLPLHVLLWEFRFLDARAATPDSGVGAGVGAFNLVRAESYRLRGTHARIRGALLDDRALGTLMRDDGGRGSVMVAVSQVRMRPYRTFKELYVGLRKSALASARNSALLSVLAGLAVGIGGVLPPLLLGLSVPIALHGHVPWAGLPALLAWLLPAAGLLKARSMVRFAPLAALFFPMGALLIAVTTMHAGSVFGMRGTVEWRGRSYSRRDLRSSIEEIG
jgi:glycosyltransferase involved in cell wall biosynthesis